MTEIAKLIPSALQSGIMQSSHQKYVFYTDYDKYVGL